MATVCRSSIFSVMTAQAARGPRSELDSDWFSCVSFWLSAGRRGRDCHRRRHHDHHDRDHRRRRRHDRTEIATTTAGARPRRAPTAAGPRSPRSARSSLSQLSSNDTYSIPATRGTAVGGGRRMRPSPLVAAATFGLVTGESSEHLAVLVDVVDPHLDLVAERRRTSSTRSMRLPPTELRDVDAGRRGPGGC